MISISGFYNEIQSTEFNQFRAKPQRISNKGFLNADAVENPSGHALGVES